MASSSAAVNAPSRVSTRMFPAPRDNYGFLLHDQATGLTAAVDTPDAAAVKRACDAAGWKLTHILNTHHHNDHAGGNLELKNIFGCTVVGAEVDRARIPGMDQGVKGGDSFNLGETRVDVIDVPGHTTGHIAFHLPEESMIFVGDALFALGCGRLFEGTPAMAKASLERITSLPPETLVFCAHEYTQTNARFSLGVDPKNKALVERSKDIDARRAKGEPTVPTTIDLELRTNPFLRAHTPSVREALGMVDADDLAVFTELRKRRDVH
eukprot:CAMPEP_0206054666 /NCGR_PEP_ID=MMETSP1466-20131121/38576_1 /ASSEMBLY_ACC=CAM_ASM_001126 /TAXON_ID=44452 /ORGANISM="Pavlova gyrans, Strain CCMP608" /LENGTH=266 /DNA_ID=CAMNT_0053429881 /DNA_START=29 /DNA_END=829 /DNA_ORIENTATION=+